MTKKDVIKKEVKYPDKDIIKEEVNHPDHYGGENNPYEVIKVLRAWLTPDEYRGFLKGNSLKYLARHRSKGGNKDLEKAEWYNHELNNFNKGLIK